MHRRYGFYEIEYSQEVHHHHHHEDVERPEEQLCSPELPSVKCQEVGLGLQADENGSITLQSLGGGRAENLLVCS